jgi:hypothetical protein
MFQAGDRVILWLRPENDGSFNAAVEREGVVHAVFPNETMTVELDREGTIVCGPITHRIEIIADEGERPAILGELGNHTADEFRRLVDPPLCSLVKSKLWVFGPHRSDTLHRAAG